MFNPEINKQFFPFPELATLHALTQLDGGERMNVLRIQRIHYVSLAKANEWVEWIIDDLHVCYTSGHPVFNLCSQEAYKNLFTIWSRMTGLGIEQYRYPATVVFG